MAKVAAEIGSTANRYQILAKLAVGGMAEIFLARGASVAGVERYCVLKRILRERSTDAQFVQMFLDEARLAAQLQHPNIASVYDVGMLGDSYFFTMEYVHGETVRSMLERAQGLRRPVPLACALTVVAGAAAGLHHAHERRSNDGRPLGIVHRDVTPSNVMVSFEGNVKLVDFGVAKAANRAVETESGTVKGKISYLSPEQCRGTRVDRRSDMFSLGIVMWEMLTGERLYRRTSDFEAMNAIVNEPPPPPSARRRDIPRAIDDIVLRLLAKDVGARFQTASAVVDAVEDASMRAGTILSTSALSRLVRDLFGVRPEPWLELDRDPMPNALVTLTSRPVSRDRGAEPVEDIEAGLASVLDLSGSNGAADRAGETRELSEADLMVTPHMGPTVAPARGATAAVNDRVPPPLPQDPALDSTIRVAPTPDALEDAEPVPVAAPRPSSAHVNATLLGVGPPRSSATREHVAVFPVPGRAAHLAPPPRIPDASAPLPIVPEPRAHDRGGSGPRHAPNPPAAGYQAPAPHPVHPAKPRRARFPWPLIAVIVVAAAVGVAVVWFMMRESSRGAAREAAPPEPAAGVSAEAGAAAAIDAATGAAVPGASAELDAASAPGVESTPPASPTGDPPPAPAEPAARSGTAVDSR